MFSNNVLGIVHINIRFNKYLTIYEHIWLFVDHYLLFIDLTCSSIYNFSFFILCPTTAGDEVEIVATEGWVVTAPSGCVLQKSPTQHPPVKVNLSRLPNTWPDGVCRRLHTFRNKIHMKMSMWKVLITW